MNTFERYKYIMDIPRGTSKTFNVRFKGIPNLIGYTGIFTLKSSKDSTTKIIEINGTISNPAILNISFKIPFNSTLIKEGDYFADVMIESVNDRIEIATMIVRILATTRYL